MSYYDHHVVKSGSWLVLFKGSTSRYILNACDLKLTWNPSNLGSLHLVHTEKYCWWEGTFIYTSKTGILSMMMFRQTGQCLHLSEQTLQTQFHRTSKNQQLCSLKAELSGTWGNSPHGECRTSYNINSADLVILYTTNPLYSSVRDMSWKVNKFATVTSLAQNTESPLIWPPMVWIKTTRP